MTEDSRRDVDGDSADVGVHQFALAGVDADTDLDAQLLGVVPQGFCAADGLGRSAEREEVPSPVLFTTVPSNRAPAWR